MGINVAAVPVLGDDVYIVAIVQCFFVIVYAALLAISWYANSIHLLVYK